jgi:hypothetical protein
MKLHRHDEGCYRTDTVGGRFGQIRKLQTRRGAEWKAEIRNSETGAFVRAAGHWPKLRAALLECEAILAADMPFPDKR